MDIKDACFQSCAFHHEESREGSDPACKLFDEDPVLRFVQVKMPFGGFYVNEA
jgi:hypothetical protein